MPGTDSCVRMTMKQQVIQIHEVEHFHHVCIKIKYHDVSLMKMCLTVWNMEPYRRGECQIKLCDVLIFPKERVLM